MRVVKPLQLQQDLVLILLLLQIHFQQLVKCHVTLQSADLGKGHLVREIDALDGIMGVVADQSGIQFRLLNSSRGHAVRGPRTQSDRELYKKYMQEMLIKLL